MSSSPNKLLSYYCGLLVAAVTRQSDMGRAGRLAQSQCGIDPKTFADDVAILRKQGPDGFENCKGFIQLKKLGDGKE